MLPLNPQKLPGVDAAGSGTGFVASALSARRFRAVRVCGSREQFAASHSTASRAVPGYFDGARKRYE